jgi:hypothetical protein
MKRAASCEYNQSFVRHYTHIQAIYDKRYEFTFVQRREKSVIYKGVLKKVCRKNLNVMLLRSTVHLKIRNNNCNCGFTWFVCNIYTIYIKQFDHNPPYIVHRYFSVQSWKIKTVSHVSLKIFSHKFVENKNGFTCIAKNIQPQISCTHKNFLA